VKRIWIAVVLVVLLAGVLVSGCSAKKVDTAAQQRAECFQNQRNIKLAMDALYADSQMYPPVATVAEKLGAKCPSGGTYQFDPTTATLSCSVHGKSQ
jgi:outer membrane murein-binding lipoprotein Lpp